MNVKSYTKRLIIILSALVVWQLQAIAQEYDSFGRYCNYPYLEKVNEVAWMKFLFKVDNCQDLRKKLSELKSYNQFIPSVMKPREGESISWTDEFPELYGITKQYSFEDVERILNVKIDYDYFFKDLAPFSDFKNLTTIDFTIHTKKRDLCSFLRWNYKIKVITLDYVSIKEYGACKNVSKKSIIMLGDYLGPADDPQANDIIGIEFTPLIADRLDRYPRLKFVGLNTIGTSSQFSSFINLTSITHLSINANKGMDEVEALGEIDSLSYLGLSCITNVHDLSKDKKNMKICENGLKDLSFLTNMRYLKSLDLRYNGLENVDQLLAMKNLESLNISQNNISTMPDFSVLPKLKKLNTESNPGTK
jgi:hypothetical protein